MSQLIMRVLAVMVLLCAPGFAGACSSNPPSCDGVPSLLYPTSVTEGQVYVGMPDGQDLSVIAGTCNLTSGVYAILYKSHPLFKETYAMLLTAVAANKPVRVRVAEASSTDTTCRVVYITMKP